MKVATKVDFFGQQFHFLINSDTHFHTVIGGILSLVSIALFLVFGYIFGKDIWFKKNPTVYESMDIKSNYTPLNFIEHDLFFPFQIQDYYGNSLNMDGTLFMSVTYNKMTFESLQVKTKTVEEVKLTKCSEYQIFVNQIRTHKYDNYFCANVTDREISGNFDIDHLNYIAVQLFACPAGLEHYNSTQCTSFSKIQEITKDRVFFSFLLPKFYSQPNNYTFPIKVEYELFTAEISSNIMTRKRISFTEINVLDDTNLLVSSVSRKKSYWEAEKIETEGFFVSEECYQEGAEVFPMLSVVLMTTQKLRTINRTYMKIMELVSLMGGFVTISRIILSFVCYYVNFYEQIAFLFWNSFDFNDQGLEDFHKNTDDSFQKPIAALNNTSFSAFDKKISKKLTKNNYLQTETQIIKTFKTVRKDRKKSKAFSIYNNFYDICCTKNEKIQNYFRKFGFDFILKRFDILTYNKLMKNFNIVRQMVLTKEQNVAINLSRNPPLFSTDELENYFGILNAASRNAREKELCQYFENKNLEKLDQQSQYIYTILEKSVQNKIFMNNTKK